MPQTPVPPNATPKMRELTLRAVLLGLVLSVVMGAANIYLGLKAGMTVSASIPAAVVAMIILRAMGKSSILEANLVQTSASAGESLAAGIIFTMPALVIVGAWQSFDLVTTALVAFAGGLLGILFMIPMRRVFVVGNKNPELTYPEGVACAAVLKAGEEEDASSSGAKTVMWGALMGILFKLGTNFLGIIKGILEGATTISSRIAYFGSDISPALFAVGFIVRFNVAILLFLGGAMAWLVGLPLLGEVPSDVDVLELANQLWASKIRYVGVGAMVVGGLSSIWKVRGGLLRAVQELRGRGEHQGQESSDDLRDRDLPSPVILTCSVAAALLVGGIYYSLTQDLAISIATTLIMLLMSFFFSAVASYIVGLVGNSNSPVSGMTITAVLATGALLYLFGFSGQQGVLATLGVAAVVCCAACTSGDVCNDLKTGNMIGAAPRNQQIMQILGIAVGSMVMAPVLQLLHENTPGGIGGRELAAPQAGLFASLTEGFFGDKQLPWDLIAIGAAIGAAILLIDAMLERRGSTFRTYLMPIAVGMYLPFSLEIPILLGGIAASLIERRLPKGAGEEEEERAFRPGILLSSGVIAGESLTGVALAVATSVGMGSLAAMMRDPSSSEPWSLLPDSAISAVTLVSALAAIALFWRLARPPGVVK